MKLLGVYDRYSLSWIKLIYVNKIRFDRVLVDFGIFLILQKKGKIKWAAQESGI